MYIQYIECTYICIYVSTLFTGYLIVCKSVLCIRWSKISPILLWPYTLGLHMHAQTCSFKSFWMKVAVKSMHVRCVLVPVYTAEHTICFTRLAIPFDLNKYTLQLGGNAAQAISANKQQQNWEKRIKQNKTNF